MLEKHGVVAFDSSDVYEVYLKASYMEEMAQFYFNSLVVTAGREPYGFPQEELERWRYPKEIRFPKI